MSRTEELICRCQAGDPEAGELLINENAGLIWSVSKRFFGRGTEADDIYQLGCLGFLKAVEGFDPEFGTQFSTYAVPKIAGEIRRYFYGINRSQPAIFAFGELNWRCQLNWLSPAKLPAGSWGRI